jgi:hypothetical protein
VTVTDRAKTLKCADLRTGAELQFTDD